MRWLTATMIRPDSSRQPCTPTAANAAAEARVHSVASVRVSRYTDGWSRCSRPLRSRLSIRARDVPAAASCARVTTPCCRDARFCSTGAHGSRSRERGATPDDRRGGEFAGGFACMAETGSDGGAYPWLRGPTCAASGRPVVPPRTGIAGHTPQLVCRPGGAGSECCRPAAQNHVVTTVLRGSSAKSHGSTGRTADLPHGSPAGVAKAAPPGVCRAAAGTRVRPLLPFVTRCSNP